MHLQFAVIAYPPWWRFFCRGTLQFDRLVHKEIANYLVVADCDERTQMVLRDQSIL